MVALLIRMVGDGVTALGWLRWLSPFGLLALSRPYAGNRGLPLLVLLGGGAACWSPSPPRRPSAATSAAGWLAPAEVARRGCGCSARCEAFAVRRMLRPLTGWALGVGAYFLLIGLIAVSMTDFLTDNPAFADPAGAGRASPGWASIEGYAATLFALLAVPVGGFAAVRISAFAPSRDRPAADPALRPADHPGPAAGRRGRRGHRRRGRARHRRRPGHLAGRHEHRRHSDLVRRRLPARGTPCRSPC